MKTLFVSLDFDALAIAKARKTPCRISVTSNTITYTIEYKNREHVKYMSTSNRIDAKHLNFIKRVKAHFLTLAAFSLSGQGALVLDSSRALNWWPGMPPSMKDSIQYSKKGQVFDLQDWPLMMVSEIDISAAYWSAAEMLGYLTPELSKEGREVPKIVRLIALGSLATRREEFYFDGEKTVKIEGGERPPTAPFWWAVCQKVDQDVRDAAEVAGDDHLFYWFDQVYTASHHAGEAVAEFMRSRGYDCKNVQYFRMEFSKDRGRVFLFRDMDDVTEGKATKSFPMRMGIAKEYFFKFAMI